MVTEVAVQFGALCPVEHRAMEDGEIDVPEGVEIAPNTS
jgi:hypothetical protein